MKLSCRKGAHQNSRCCRNISRKASPFILQKNTRMCSRWFLMGKADRPGKKAVIVFLKFPEKGKVKTRLSKVLDESFVLALYKGFIHDTLLALQSFPDISIYFLPLEKEGHLRSWLGSGYQYFAQTGKDLGEKMSNAFKDVFQRGY